MRIAVAQTHHKNAPLCHSKHELCTQMCVKHTQEAETTKYNKCNKLKTENVILISNITTNRKKKWRLSTAELKSTFSVV